MDLRVGNRVIGTGSSPLVIAEIGINHEGNFDKAIQMIDDARAAGC
jgi:N-acetylneuraminate synthase